MQPQYLFCPQIKSEKGTPTLTLVAIGNTHTHTHTHTPCLVSSVAQLCPTLCDPMDCTPQGPLSMAFSRQEYWSGLLCPPPGYLPYPGIKPASLASPCVGRWIIFFFFFTTKLPGKTEICLILQLKIQYLLSSFFSIVISFVGLFSLKG